MIKVYYIVDTRQEQYTYDKNGNRNTESITESHTILTNYTYYPNTDRLKSNDKYTFEYDANGNLTKKTLLGKDGTVWKYDYDLLNRLTQVRKNDTVIASYVYDESGLRLKKTGPQGTTYYSFDQSGNVLCEQTGNTYLDYVYVLGKHFARVDGNTSTGITKKYFYQTDNLGSTVLVTDENGKQVYSSEYTPFGKQVGIDGELDHVIKFTGKDLDEDTGLYYYNARWYDQDTGRFITPDTFNYLPSDERINNIDSNKQEILSEGFENPLRYNYYEYCLNNPIKNTDFDGHDVDAGTVTTGIEGLGVILSMASGVGEAVLGVTLIAAGIFAAANNIHDAVMESNKKEEAEHTKGARNSTKEKHEKGQKRKKLDKGGEKGDARRRY